MLKIACLNIQSIQNIHDDITNFVHSFDTNTIFEFTETWLHEEHDVNLWAIDNHFTCFRQDRKTRGSGIMMLVPKQFHPRRRTDLEKSHNDLIEDIWIECKIGHRNKSTRLINLSYNPQKINTDSFLEQLVIGIDNAVAENKPIILMGDYNINWLNNLEREKLDSITTPYGLSSTNESTPTRISNTSRTLIDYIFTNDEMIHSYVAQVNFNTDHLCTLGTFLLSSGKITPVLRTIIDKSAYKITLNNTFNKHSIPLIGIFLTLVLQLMKNGPSFVNSFHLLFQYMLLRKKCSSEMIRGSLLTISLMRNTFF